VVAAYRVLVLGQSPRDAYGELARYGWNAETDQVLLTYLNSNLPRVAEETTWSASGSSWTGPRTAR
jgi:hypothetical protein